jgi:Txe/YoeB family toxin of toxin-antitoxin system
VRFVFTPNGWDDYVFWQSSDRTTLRRINRLLDDVARDPFAGTASPNSSVTRSREHGHAVSMRNTDSCT